MTTILVDQSSDLKLLNIIMPRLKKSFRHYRELSEQHQIELAGYEGEQSLYYYIRQFPEPFFHLHSLYFRAHRSACQIDHLIIFPTFILIIESKHLKGELRYQVDTGVLEQTIHQHKIRRGDPIAQAEIQKGKLKKLIQSSPYPPLPIHRLVVFTHDEAFPVIEGHEPDIMIKERLPNRVQNLMEQYSSTSDAHDQIENIAQYVASAHQPKPSELLKDHPSLVAELNFGVRCTNCENAMMKRVFNNWECLSCQHRDRLAHLQSLKECRMIFGQELTCKTVATFLDIPLHLARQFLKRNAKQQGKNRGTTYLFN